MESDLPEARVVHRRAFGTFLGIDPPTFRPGADCLGPRWRMWPEGGFVAMNADRLVGSALLSHWGSGCIVGPVTVDPDAWGGGVARALLEALVDRIDEQKFLWTGLFTHPHSPLHVRLYEQFGFCMQRITGIMSKTPSDPATSQQALEFSTLSGPEKASALAGLRALSETVSPGLDWREEVRSIDREKIGETILTVNPGQPGQIDGFACLHFGAGSESSTGDCLVKVAAIRHGLNDSARFTNLLHAIDGAVPRLGADRIVAGTNTGRAEAYRMMKAHGYRTDTNGIAMFRPSGDVYNTPGKFVIDDWR